MVLLESNALGSYGHAYDMQPTRNSIVKDEIAAETEALLGDQGESLYK